MRILHVITSLRVGGAERMVAELLPRLRERGHQVELLLFDGTRSPLYDCVEQQGIPIYALGKGSWQMWNPLHGFRLRRFLNHERFDLVHAHNTPCQLLTALAAPKKAPILVTTEHNTFNRRRRWRWYNGLDRWMYSKYHHIACVGKMVKSKLMNELGRRFESRVSVVPNGIDLNRFLHAVPDETLRQPVDVGKKIILMVAAFRAQKDHPTMLRALQYLSDDYRLWLVGDGPERRSCETLAEEMHISSKVQFWGVQSDIARFFATADVIVLSSHYEGFGLAIVEGMAAGKAAIASDVDGLHEVVEGAGLFFPSGDDKQLAGLIRQVCEDRTYGLAVAARCRARAMQYDIEQVVSAYVRIYNDLILSNKREAYE